MDDFAAINEVYAKYFPEPFPARSCIEVARIPKDVLLEAEAIKDSHISETEGFQEKRS